MILLYNILLLLGGALGLPFFVVKALTGEKRRATIWKRLGVGHPKCLLPAKPIWIHALSVGEVLSSTGLIKKLKEGYPDCSLVFSVSTRGGYEIARKSFAKERDFIFFFPYDFIWTVRPLIRRIDPLLFLLIETDLWPNFLNELAKFGVPAILVNGRISPRSYRRYKRVSFFTKHLFSSFDCCCMQTETDANRIVAIGALPDKVHITGNIKFDQPMVSASDEEISVLRASLQIRPMARVFVAGSTHEGEEAILLRCFKALKKSFPDLVLIVVPRDPGRAYAVQRVFEQAGFVAPLRTGLDKMDTDAIPEAIIVDSIGELRWLYAIGDVVFVGKSLVNLGGQNPLEPAALKKPILFGPHMFNFELVAQMLVREGGAFQVADEEELLEQVKSLLLDPKRSNLMGERAYEVFCMNRGAVEKTLRIVERFLQPFGPKPHHGRRP